MKEVLIGRIEEQKELQKALVSNKAELISVTGRLRIGKTFLIRSFYKDQISFEVAGIQGASLSIQLRNFTTQLTKFIRTTSDLLVPIEQAKDWFAAFVLLIEYLERKKSEDKQVVFFDELPWLSTHKSGFLAAFSYFWNSWAVQQRIVVIICGSAASWMIRKVVHHRGGLHNRITRQLVLEPFTLAETEEYLWSRGIRIERYHILQLYMAIGGIPHYLEALQPGLSATQNIEQIAFSKTALLKDEFSKLYHSLFARADRHIQVIRTLADRKQGLTRKQILENSQLSEGGSIQKVLEELRQSGFIMAYHPFGKKKNFTV
ncbi:MAG: ATP-binding protein [Bacteroidota bacterium]